MNYAYIGSFLLIITAIILGAVALGLIAGPAAVLGLLSVASLAIGLWLGHAAATSEAVTPE